MNITARLSALAVRKTQAHQFDQSIRHEIYLPSPEEMDLKERDHGHDLEGINIERLQVIMNKSKGFRNYIPGVVTLQETALLLIFLLKTKKGEGKVVASRLQFTLPLWIRADLASVVRTWGTTRR